jgi:hypothetical protein
VWKEAVSYQQSAFSYCDRYQSVILNLMSVPNLFILSAGGALPPESKSRPELAEGDLYRSYKFVPSLRDSDFYFTPTQR